MDQAMENVVLKKKIDRQERIINSIQETHKKEIESLKEVHAKMVAHIEKCKDDEISLIYNELARSGRELEKTHKEKWDLKWHNRQKDNETLIDLRNKVEELEKLLKAEKCISFDLRDRLDQICIRIPNWIRRFYGAQDE